MMRAAAAFGLTAALLAGCSTVQPLAEVSPSRTTPPLPSGAAVVSEVAGAPVESCDATASLRPSTARSGRRRDCPPRQVDRRVDHPSSASGFPTPANCRGSTSTSRANCPRLLGDPDKVQFRSLTSPERISALQDKSVDIVAKTMTITCARAEQIAFSTVYFDASQRLLVPKDFAD